MRPLFVACFALNLLLAPVAGLAHEPPSSSASTAPAARANRQQASSRAPAGVWVAMIASLAAGAATTAYGLSVTCADTDHGCRRRSSVAIWGGIGIASLGSAIALGSLQEDTAQPLSTSRTLQLRVQTGAEPTPLRTGAGTILSVAGVFD